MVDIIVEGRGGAAQIGDVLLDHRMDAAAVHNVVHRGAVNDEIKVNWFSVQRITIMQL